MPRYIAPVEDTSFVLNNVLGIPESDIPGYADLTRDFTSAILEEAGKISSELLQPLNMVGDTQGCTFENGVVRTPAGFREAFERIKEGGWTGLDLPEEFGGQDLPTVMGTAVNEYFVAANQAFAMYQGLSRGAAAAILAHGSEAQKRTYLPKLVTCEWTGTMNLTEAQCGTDLGLIRTKAEPQGDGSYRVTGEKIFISSGDHDLADNIVHLVLARIAGGPKGIKGISLFIVPKFLVNEDGSPGTRNGVSVGKIERKQGIHGNATCVMNFQNAVGYLAGEEHRGMHAMFTMMNVARLGVGMQGLALAHAAYLNARDYARNRLQGRDTVKAQNPDGPADPLIVHPDIRRVLMDQKSFVEGARAFALWVATLIDRSQRLDDRNASGLVALLTPVVKGFLTDEGHDMTVKAQQVYGGHGYIEETGMSQYTRDARIAMIYEGANGVQALDLVGRKLAKDGGAPLRSFLELVQRFCDENRENGDMADFVTPLDSALGDMRNSIKYFMRFGIKDPHNALAGSYDFMHLFGHVCLGLMWSWIAKSACDALTREIPDQAFLNAKLATGRYYMVRRLPMTRTHLARIESGAAPVMSLPEESF